MKNLCHITLPMNFKKIQLIARYIKRDMNNQILFIRYFTAFFGLSSKKITSFKLSVLFLETECMAALSHILRGKLAMIGAYRHGS